jgi:PmbA protein
VTHPEVQSLASRVVDSAQPGEAIEAFVSSSRSTTVRANEAEGESLTSSTNHAGGSRGSDAGRPGFAHCGTHDPESVDAALAAARDNARHVAPDEFVGLIEPDSAAAPKLELYDLGVEELDADGRIDRAIELERRVTGADSRITGVRSANYSDGVGEFALVSSSGVEAYDRSSSAVMSVSALASDGDSSSTGAGWDAGRGPADLDMELAATRAIDAALGQLGASKPDSARLTAVFDPQTTATFMGLVASMLCADRVQTGRSPFADRLNETVAARCFNLVDDPTEPLSLGADHFDGEGLASRPLSLISTGELESFAYDGYTARKGGTISTASAVRGVRSLPSPGIRALQLGIGDRDVEAVIGDIALGVHVRSLTGVHSGVNPISGDFSVGMEGNMIRDGAIAEPIREATLGGTMQRMLGSVAEIATDREWLSSGVGSATMAIDDVALSGN